MSDNPSWKTGSRRIASRELASAVESGWRNPRGTSTVSPLRRRVRRALYIFGLLSAVSATFVAVLFWLQPPPPARLILIGAGYEDNLELPPNTAGRQALGRFAQLASNSLPWSAVFPRSGQLHLEDGVVEFCAGDNWSAGLTSCPEPTLVVFFAVHAGADTEGPFLLPGEAGPAPASRIRFDQVLDRLAALPARKNKVLILDGSRLDDNWALGMLQNDFVRAVAALEVRIAAIPNLIVIISSDVDQSSWDRGLGGTSVFSHFLLEGLSRRPNVHGGSFFTAWDLYVDVRDQVQQWVSTYRHAEQTPLLLPREGGEQRARAIPLVFRLEPLPVPEQPDPLPAIQAVWQRLERLQQEAPAALFRTPHLWQRMEALLLRHEQLLLAGGQAAVEGIRDRALATEEEIRQRQVLPLRSVTATLAMPALVGETSLDVPASYAPFEQLWAARPGDRPALWLKLQSAEGPGLPAQALVRRRMFESLVRRAAEAPQRNLALAAELARLVHDASTSGLPAEAHFLVMLSRDLPQPLSEKNATLVGRALRIRLLAEQAVMGCQPGVIPYPEYVLPWIRDSVAAADDDRRLGEDLLFATASDDLAEASRHLDQAENGYRQVIVDAAVARFAIQQRNEAVHELAHYARWASRSPRDVLQEIGANIVGLWTQVHELGQLLRADPSHSRLAELKNLAEDVRGSLARLRARFEQCAQAASVTDSPDLETLCALLEVPTLPVSIRMTLLKNRLQLERRALDGIESTTPVRAATAVNPEDRRQRAQIRGEMALAALGERWFNLGAGPDRESYAEVYRRLQTFSKEDPWWPSLAQAESEIGDRWLWLAAESDRFVDRARKELDPDRSRSLCWEGDQLVRRGMTMNSAGAASLKLRHWLAAQALLFQASRVEGDHWADERPAAVAYYQTTARALLRDARLISQRESLTLAGLAELETRLDGVDTFDLQVTQRADLTPGDVARLTVFLAGPLRPGLAGFPVVWSETLPRSAEKDALELASSPPGQRTVMTIGGATPPAPLRVDVISPLLERLERNPPPLPTPLLMRVVWTALHRGFRVERPTEISLHPRADVVSITQPPPRDAAVAVAADSQLLRRMGRARGALAIVLDCSGSMGAAGAQPSTEPTRFQLVTQALRVLLENTPAGTTVSLWVFGQAVGEEKTAEPVEATIMRLLDPLTWTGEQTQVREVLARAEGLVPWNESPVFRAMLSARQDLLRAEGPRTMMVLTDGIDNRFAQDREANPASEQVPDALRHQFRGTGIAIHVVGFQVANREDDEAQRQFGPVAELDPPGTFCTVDAVEDLISSVRRISRSALQYQLTCQDTLETADSPSPSAGMVGTDDDSLRWLVIPLAGRTHTFQLSLAPDERIAGSVAVSPGDALSLQLVPRGNELGLQRLPFAPRADLLSGRVLQHGNWLAAVAQYDRMDAGGLQLLLTLEPQLMDDENPVRMHRPADLWVELASADGQVCAVQWRSVAGYPAHAWKIEVPAWPVGADQTPVPARLRVWWRGDRPAVPSVSLRRQEDFRAPENIARRMRIEGDEVVIESVRVEPRSTDLGDKMSLSATDTQWCVAVRISHPPDRPVRVSLEGLGTLRGEEHRYYRAAGKYVGLFQVGGVTTQSEMRDRLENDLQALYLTSLTALCQQADQEGHAVEFVNLGKPAARNVPPAKPVSLE